MALRSKVAALLATLLLALPFASAAACLLHRPQSAGKVSHCQMLRHHGMSAGRQNARLNNECCELSSRQSLPPSRPEVPGGTFDATAPVISAATLDVPQAPIRIADTPPVQATGPSHQAVLCVFLI